MSDLELLDLGPSRLLVLRPVMPSRSSVPITARCCSLKLPVRHGALLSARTTPKAQRKKSRHFEVDLSGVLLASRTRKELSH